MVKLEFFDDNDKFIHNIDTSDGLPDKVSKIEIDGPFGSNRSNCKILTSLLKGSQRKLKSISLGWTSEESPEFLAFLVLICSKTNSLRLCNYNLSSNAASCLMGALMIPNGLRSLSICFVGSLPAHQAKIILEGVACSPFLESFELDVTSYEDNLTVAQYLIEALQRNQTLKNITLATYSLLLGLPSTFFTRVLNAAILGPPQVKSLRIIESDRELPLDELQMILCDKNCSLEKLQLDCVEISIGDGCLGSIVQNVSVKSLEIISSLLDSGQMKKIISLFKSLEELNLSYGNITELSFLDPLLYTGGRSQLKKLDMRSNDVGQEEMELFIGKLQNIKGLKYLGLLPMNGPDVSYPITTSLVNAIRDNTDLECVAFYHKDLALDLNRAGRRVFEPSQTFPRNLLPLVLERASKISYYKHDDEWDEPSNTEPRADIVYWMVQRIAPQF